MFLIEKLAEQKINEAIKAGELDDLELRGTPYNMDGYLFEDPSIRIEMKILRDHHFLPMPLQLKKEIDEKMLQLHQRLDGFRRYYVEKFRDILKRMEIDPGYQPENYDLNVSRHKTFVGSSFPLWYSIKSSNDIRLQVALFNNRIIGMKQTVSTEGEGLRQLISDYNSEIIRASFKKRDRFRNFTTMGTGIIKTLIESFDERFPPLKIG